MSRQPRENTAILIRNGRITAVGTPDEIGLPDGATLLEIAGKWVIPGLIDMHVHIKDLSAPYFVAAGDDELFARALGRLDLGVIRPGAMADLVILNGNPLADIANTLLTDRVVKGGVLRPDRSTNG